MLTMSSSGALSDGTERPCADHCIALRPWVQGQQLLCVILLDIEAPEVLPSRDLKLGCSTSPGNEKNSSSACGDGTTGYVKRYLGYPAPSEEPFPAGSTVNHASAYKIMVTIRSALDEVVRQKSAARLVRVPTLEASRLRQRIPSPSG